MKLLFCIPNFGYGGAERQLSYLAVKLAEKGHEVHVASSRGGINLDRLTNSKIKWHALGGFSNRDPIIFFRLIRLIMQLKPDILQTILTPMDLMGGAAALLTRTRWILKESSSASLYQAASFRNKLRLMLGKHAYAIISNSAGGDDYWRTAGAKKRFIIPNTVPFDEISKEIPFSLIEEKAYSSGDNKFLLFAGRLDKGKNVETLILALSKIADDIPFIAIICGDGPQRPKLESLAKKLGLEKRLFFLGYVSNLWSVMKKADLFISLSRFEGCPNVVLEAAACGTPLAVSDIPAHREILDENLAHFINPNDVNSAANAIKEILTNSSTLQLRAQKALEKVSVMKIEDTAGHYEQLYLNCLNKEFCFSESAIELN